MDQALNLVTRVSYPSYASIPSDVSAFLDGMDAMDDLDVVADVATDRRCSKLKQGSQYVLAGAILAAPFVVVLLVRSVRRLRGRANRVAPVRSAGVAVRETLPV